MDDGPDFDALVAAVRAGDEQAFEALVLAAEPALRACVAAHATSAQQVEEVVQDTLVAIYQSLHQYRGSGAFLAWMKTIARNRIRADLRAQRKLVDDGSLASAVVIDAQLERLESDEASERAEAEIDRLRACIDRLEPGLRSLVLGHHLQGLGLDELGRRIGRGANWVAVRLHRIRRALARCVGGSSR